MKADISNVTVGTQLKYRPSTLGTMMCKNDHIIVTKIANNWIDYRLLNGSSQTRLMARFHASTLYQYDVVDHVEADQTNVKVGDVLVYISHPHQHESIKEYEFLQIGLMIKVTKVGKTDIEYDAYGNDEGFPVYDGARRRIFMSSLCFFAKVNLSSDAYSDYEQSNDEYSEPEWDTVLQKLTQYQSLKAEIDIEEKKLEDKRNALSALKAEIIGAL